MVVFILFRFGDYDGFGIVEVGIGDFYVEDLVRDVWDVWVCGVKVDLWVGIGDEGVDVVVWV